MLTKTDDIRRALFVFMYEVQQAYERHYTSMLEAQRTFDRRKRETDHMLRQDLDQYRKSLLTNMEVED